MPWATAIQTAAAVYLRQQRELEIKKSEIAQKLLYAELSYKIHKPVIVVTKATKCPCCGSYEYVEHKTISICAYCRVPQFDKKSEINSLESLSFQKAKEQAYINYMKYTSGYV